MADNCGRVHGRLGRSEIRGRRRSEGIAREQRGDSEKGGERWLGAEVAEEEEES